MSAVTIGTFDTLALESIFCPYYSVKNVSSFTVFSPNGCTAGKNKTPTGTAVNQGSKRMPINRSSDYHQHSIINSCFITWFFNGNVCFRIKNRVYLLFLSSAAPDFGVTFPIEFCKISAWISRQCLSDCSVAVVLDGVTSSVVFTTVSNARATIRVSLRRFRDTLS